MTNASTTCVKNQKNVSSGTNILKSNSKYPTPNQVKNIIPMVLVRNPMPVNPNDIKLPRCVTTYNPTIMCIRFNIIGANTPKVKYNINNYYELFLHKNCF